MLWTIILQAHTRANAKENSPIMYSMDVRSLKLMFLTELLLCISLIANIGMASVCYNGLLW